MKPKMKYSTKKISVAKLNSTANKALVKPYELIKSQQKTEEVCHLYSMELRSGLTIEKRACYIRKRTSKRPSLGKNPPQTGGKESLSFTAYRQQSTVEHFAFGVPEIQRHTKRFHVPRTTEKVLLRYYESQRSSSESGDDVDGKMLMVNLGPPTKDHWLHANNKEHSVELHKSEKPLPEQAFFVLHKQPFKSVSSECVSFECKNYPGTYLGVKDNQLALIKVDCSESLSSENIMFKLSKT
uniref:Interleukin-33 n=1 Tax=Microcebus murinus TaxID=30608 RepID=A0A8C5VAR1_MICMU